jgi:hypothetical protein
MPTQEEAKRYNWRVDDNLNVWVCLGHHEKCLACDWELASFAFFVPGVDVNLERLHPFERAVASPEKNGWIVYQVSDFTSAAARAAHAEEEEA